MIPSTLALRTTCYLSMETEYLPWKSALDNLQYVSLMLERTEVHPLVQVPLRPPSSQTSPPQSRLWITSLGLPPGADHASVPALQEHHIQLDVCSGAAH